MQWGLEFEWEVFIEEGIPSSLAYDVFYSNSFNMNL